MREYLVDDIFWTRHPDNKEALADTVSLFQHGYWAQIIHDTLFENGVNATKTDEICKQFFDIEVPRYCKENIENYPQKYGGLMFMVRKGQF